MTVEMKHLTSGTSETGWTAVLLQAKEKRRCEEKKLNIHIYAFFKICSHFNACIIH